LRRHPDAGGMGNLLAPPGTVIRAFDTRERDMRRRIARTGARIMATNVVALTQPTNLSDIQADVRNALDARGRLPTLLDVLAVQRVDAVNAFLRTFAADLAAVKGDPDKAFVDAQFAKFTAWKTADDEFAKRIDALNAISASLE